MLNRVVFLDRDGVINRDSDRFIKDVSEFIFLPRSLDAFRLLTENGIDVIIISNQSGIGRGIIAPRNLETIHRFLIESVEKTGGRIRDIFFCPHAPSDQCDCRKPKPGLILKARDIYGLALSETAMVGDKAIDIECGRNAGCGRSLLVRTGHGEEAARQLAERGAPVDYLADDLYDAVRYLLSGFASELTASSVRSELPT